MDGGLLEADGGDAVHSDRHEVDDDLHEHGPVREVGPVFVHVFDLLLDLARQLLAVLALEYCSHEALSDLASVAVVPVVHGVLQRASETESILYINPGTGRISGDGVRYLSMPSTKLAASTWS